MKGGLNLKRTISKILIILMILSSVPTVFAQENTAVSDEIRNNAALLNALDITDTDIDNTIWEEGISQKSFAVMIMRSMFDNFDSDDDELINSMIFGMKIADKDEYNPNKLLSREQAINMALGALGYSIFDGYKNAPDAKARQALQKNINTKNKYITASDAITLICNMLDEKVLYVYSISDGYVKSRTSETETILSHYRKISKLEDVVTDSGISNIYGESTIGTDKAYVGDYLIDCEPGQMREYLGMNVVIYTRSDSKSDARLIYVYAKDNNILKIDDEDIVKADLSVIKYSDEHSKVKSASVNSLAKVIYNGEAYPECTAAELDLKNGFIELIDNDGSGGYDIIKVTKYKTMVAKYVSSDEMKIINEFENADALKEIKLASSNEKQRIIKNGAEIGISKVSVGNTLSVVQSKSGRVTDIYVSDKSFDGYVEKIDKGDKKLTIDGKEFYYTKEFEKMSEYGEAYAKYPTVGAEYTFRTDINGKIAAVSVSDNSSIKYAYLAYVSENGVFDKEVKFKMFDQNGEWVIYDLKDKLRFGGKSGYTPGEVYEKIGGSGFQPQLVQYKLDAEDKIKEVNVAVVTSDTGVDEFSRKADEENRYILQSNSFENTVFIDNGAYMWFIPEDKTCEEMYFIGGTANLIADRKYTYSAYNVDESGSAAYYTVNLTDENLEYQSFMFALVTGVGSRLDINGDVVDCITCYIDKYSNETLNLSDRIDASNIKKGDIIRVYLNAAGTIENMVKMWSISDGEVENIPTANTLRGEATLAVTGHINSVYPDKNLIVLRKAGVIQPLRVRDGGRVLIYHKEQNLVRDASLRDILPNDYAVLFSRSSSIYNAVIVRD